VLVSPLQFDHEAGEVIEVLTTPPATATSTAAVTVTRTPAVTRTAVVTRTVTRTPVVTRTAVVTRTPTGPKCADVTGDGKVKVLDVVLIALHMGKKQGQWGYHPKYDLNNDGKINVKDLLIAVHQLGRRC
jgi:hypothetical protein